MSWGFRLRKEEDAATGGADEDASGSSAPPAVEPSSLGTAPLWVWAALAPMPARRPLPSVRLAALAGETGADSGSLTDCCRDSSALPDSSSGPTDSKDSSIPASCGSAAEVGEPSWSRGGLRAMLPSTTDSLTASYTSETAGAPDCSSLLIKCDASPTALDFVDAGWSASSPLAARLALGTSASGASSAWEASATLLGASPTASSRPLAGSRGSDTEAVAAALRRLLPNAAASTASCRAASSAGAAGGDGLAAGATPPSSPASAAEAPAAAGSSCPSPKMPSNFLLALASHSSICLAEPSLAWGAGASAAGAPAGTATGEGSGGGPSAGAGAGRGDGQATAAFPSGAAGGLAASADAPPGEAGTALTTAACEPNDAGGHIKALGGNSESRPVATALDEPATPAACLGLCCAAAAAAASASLLLSLASGGSRPTRWRGSEKDRTLLPTLLTGGLCCPEAGDNGEAAGTGGRGALGNGSRRRAGDEERARGFRNTGVEHWEEGLLLSTEGRRVAGKLLGCRAAPEPCGRGARGGRDCTTERTSASRRRRAASWRSCSHLATVGFGWQGPMRLLASVAIIRLTP